jgi:photosynthetic reaction center H subunit
METGAITGYIDVAQIVLYVFWLFFFSLVVYLHRESKREGYPAVADTPGDGNPAGLWGMPQPKTFLLPHGGSRMAPPGAGQDDRKIKAEPTSWAPGSPLEPTGDPLVDGVGPASWAMRSDEPDLHTDGQAKIVPLRVATGYVVAAEDDDPRGMPVIAACGGVAGIVTEVWVDRSESIVRYLEVEPEGGGARLLLPVPFSTISRGRVRVESLYVKHFANIPRTRHPDQVTFREEDQICGYYGGGHLYADPSRLGPLL